MKKLLFLTPFFFLNCNKKETVSKSTGDKDSTIIIKNSSSEKTTDSAKNGVVSINRTDKKTNTISKTFRVVEGDRISKTISAEMLPLTISEEFTNDRQKFILKIKNFKGHKIEGIITPENKNMNIRFNQIKRPNGDYDGPFGREISEKITGNGEIWLIVGKSLMVSANSKGKFTINIK